MTKHRKIERTADQKRELKRIRERFQREKPSLNELVTGGDADEPVSHGEYVSLLKLMAALKRHREARGA